MIQYSFMTTSPVKRNHDELFLKTSMTQDIFRSKHILILLGLMIPSNSTVTPFNHHWLTS